MTTVAEALKQKKELERDCSSLRVYIADLEREIGAKNAAIQTLSKPKKQNLPMWIKVKESSFNITEEYLKKIIAQIGPVADVVHIEYGRLEGR